LPTFAATQKELAPAFASSVWHLSRLELEYETTTAVEVFSERCGRKQKGAGLSRGAF
jgi:hypothetical protein